MSPTTRPLPRALPPEAAEHRSELGLLLASAAASASSSVYSSRASRATTDSPSPTTPLSRSPSRITASIKSLLARPPLQSPSCTSFNSSATPSDSEASLHSFQVPGKRSTTPRKSRTLDPQVTGTVAAAAAVASSHHLSVEAHRRYASEARAGKSHDPQILPSKNSPPDPRARNVLRRRPSALAKFARARERGMSSPSPPHFCNTDFSEPPSLLTPAGAVVVAYKQQELHRDDMPNFAIPSIDDQMGPINSHFGALSWGHLDHSTNPPTPYCTPSGSSARPGQTGDRWSGLAADQSTRNTSQATPAHQPSASDPSGRSLTRKVSSTWRKVKGRATTLDESSAHDKGHSKGTSLQEMWGINKSVTCPTGRSIATSNAGPSAGSSSSASHARSGSEKDARKIWRLMRRISTGGLRDRFHSEKSVPPVPAIPKELLDKVNQDRLRNEPVETPHHQPSLLHGKGHSSPFKDVLVIRQSAAIPSSSSNSSDVASTQFFHKAHSARSSVSSYGGFVVTSRTPEFALDQHIIAPLEQLRLGEDQAESDEQGASSVPVPRSPRRSASVPASLRPDSAQGEFVLVPSPRRQTCSGETPFPTSPRHSPTPTLASGNQRASRQSYGHGVSESRVDGIMSLSPPPRPAKNTRRGGYTTGSPSHSVPAKPVEGNVGSGHGFARQMDRTSSARSEMTARIEPPEPRPSQDRDATPHGLTFREFGATRRPPLSEREKVDIWNDLLDRSERAGGTLHINGAAELMSDNMRFSTLSQS